MSNTRSDKTAILMYANPEIDADMLYFGKFLAPDPFMAVGLGRRRIGILSPLELGRASKQSGFTDILSLTDVRSSAKRELGVDNPKTSDIARFIAQSYGIGTYKVPHNFPHAIAQELVDAGVKVVLGTDPFFPEREKKTDAEAEAIREGNRLSSAGFKLVQKVLKESEINKKGFLIYGGKKLTSEFLQQEIAKRILELGGVSANTIVAGGDQACDPHERGSGPLKANELIIVDIFPRVNATHFHGDMTRTYLKGKASPEQKRLVAAVKAAHGKALDLVKARVKGGQIHKAVSDYFEENGYKTERHGDTFTGFFHGTGHGLGLDVHEAPRVSTGAGALKAGNVVTIEPGLYYPGLGGCRIEDVVRVTGNGYEMLSKHSYTWEIK
ncbi:MAG: M24 family metallopeptidase [Opitutales bacterium]